MLSHTSNLGKFGETNTTKFDVKIECFVWIQPCKQLQTPNSIKAFNNEYKFLGTNEGIHMVKMKNLTTQYIFYRKYGSRPMLEGDLHGCFKNSRLGSEYQDHNLNITTS